MSQPFVGEIKMFGGNFAPRSYAFCNGQLLSISQNTALFSLLGTTYGGNGTTTFALPNLQGRFPMHWGNGPGLSPRAIGESSGTETTTLSAAQMPAHNHVVNVATSTGTVSAAANNLLAASSTRGETHYAAAGGTTAALNPASLSSTGGSQPLSIMPPFLAVTFIIALFGIFPSRN